MSPTEWGIIITICIAMIGGSIGFGIKAYQIIMKESQNRENSISRVYQRFDAIKEVNKKEFTLQQVCDEKHKRTDEALNRIETKVNQIFEILRKT